MGTPEDLECYYCDLDRGGKQGVLTCCVHRSLELYAQQVASDFASGHSDSARNLADQELFSAFAEWLATDEGQDSKENHVWPEEVLSEQESRAGWMMTVTLASTKAEAAVKGTLPSEELLRPTWDEMSALLVHVLEEGSEQARRAGFEVEVHILNDQAGDATLTKRGLFGTKRRTLRVQVGDWGEVRTEMTN